MAEQRSRSPRGRVVPAGLGVDGHVHRRPPKLAPATTSDLNICDVGRAQELRTGTTSRLPVPTLTSQRVPCSFAPSSHRVRLDQTPAVGPDSDVTETDPGDSSTPESDSASADLAQIPEPDSATLDGLDGDNSGEVSDSTEFPAKEIIGETESRYLISWEDDPVTGRAYSPTWEPKRNANNTLVIAWRRGVKKSPSLAYQYRPNYPSRLRTLDSAASPPIPRSVSPEGGSRFWRTISNSSDSHAGSNMAPPEPAPSTADRAASPASSVLSDLASMPDDRVPGLAPNHRTLLVPIAGTVRQLIRSVIASYADVLQQLVSGKRDSSTLRRQCQTFISSVLKIGFHQDLVNEEAMTQLSDGAVSPAQQANWDRSICPKLRFLDTMVTQLQLRGQGANLGVLACDPDTQKIVKTFLNGSMVEFIDFTDRTRKEDEQEDTDLEVRVSILDGKCLSKIPGNISVIVSINYDCQLEAEALVKLNREWERRYPDVPPPTVISLVPCFSAEHIARCLPSNLDELVRLRSFASSIAHYRGKAGWLPAQYPGVDSLAASVVHYLFPSARGDPAAGLESEAINPFETYPQLPMIEVFKAESSTTNSTAKRPLSPGLGTLTTPTSSKRPRLFSEQVAEWDVSRIANTAEESVPESSTRAESRVLYTRISDLAGCLESVQEAFENRTKLYQLMKQEKRVLEKKYADVQSRWAGTRERLADASRKYRDVHQELAKLRSAVAGGQAVEGGTGPASEVEQLRQSLVLAREETDKALDRLQSRGQELDAIRGVYQEIGARNRELVQENEKLQAKVDRLNRRLVSQANAVQAAAALVMDATTLPSTAGSGVGVGTTEANGSVPPADVPLLSDAVLEMPALDPLFLPTTDFLDVPAPFHPEMATTGGGGEADLVPSSLSSLPSLSFLTFGPTTTTTKTTGVATTDTFPTVTGVDPIVPSIPNPITMTTSARIAESDRQVAQLRARTESLEALVRLKEDEIKRLSSRITTRPGGRATTPRSPRVYRSVTAEGGVVGSSRAGSPIGRVGVVRGL